MLFYMKKTQISEIYTVPFLFLDFEKGMSPKSLDGAVIGQLNDFFFLTDPDIFQYFCLPNDPKWQLVPKTISVEKFLSLPYLKQDFFENKLKFLSASSCRLETIHGECDVIIKVPENFSLTFSYDLCFKNTDSNSKQPPQTQLKNYVAVIHQDCKVTFSVRCPAVGMYILKVEGNQQGEKSWLFSSCIECSEVKAQVSPYPTVPEIGFGPQKLTYDAGLHALSHKTGYVHVQRNKTCEFSFLLEKFVIVHATLHRSAISSANLAQYVSQRIQNDNLRIDVTPPQDGEYTLHINCKEKGSTKGFMNVCNYLLNTDTKKMRSWEVSIPQS